MNLDELDWTMTWGARMADVGRALRVRWPTVPLLAEAIAPVIERLAALPAPNAERFRRKEAKAIHTAAALEAAPAMEEPGAPLPSPLRERIDDVAPSAARALRVHTDDPADALARGHRAVAVTIGSDVFFRRGEYRPEDQRGFALLAHEATHVAAALDPSLATRRITPLGVAAEEGLARAREAALRDPGAGRIPMRSVVAPAAQSPAAPAVPLTDRPMAAAEDRPLDEPTRTAPRLDVDGLRRGLFRDLLAQLRSDFERGG
jgi:hypothetical protein